MKTLKSALSTIVFICLSALSCISCSDPDEEYADAPKQEQDYLNPRVPYGQALATFKTLDPDSAHATFYNKTAWDYMEYMTHLQIDITYRNNIPVKLEPANPNNYRLELTYLDPQATYSAIALEVYVCFPRDRFDELHSMLSKVYGSPHKNIEGIYSYSYSFDPLKLGDRSYHYNLQGYYDYVKLSAHLDSYSIYKDGSGSDHIGYSELSGQAVLDIIDDLSAIITSL